MFDLTRTELAGFSKFGFSKTYSLEKLRENLFLETEDCGEARKKGRKKKLFLIKTYETGPGMIKSVAGGKGAFVVDIRGIVNSGGAKRGAEISKRRIFLQQCIKQNAKYILASLAEEEFEMRSSREMIALGMILGLEYEQAKKSLKRLKGLLEDKNEA